MAESGLSAGGGGLGALTIGRALAAACTDREVLTRIGGSVGAQALQAHDELSALAEVPRRAKRAGWAAIARAPVPSGFRGVDPSWIEAALVDLPPRARAAVAGSRDAMDAYDAAIDVWFARWACAAIPPLPTIDPSLSRPRSFVDTSRLAPDALRGWIEGVGADQLAYALGDPEAIAATARVVGDRLTTAAKRITRPPRQGALGPRRAAIGRARVAPDPRALFVIGARAIAPQLAAEAGPLLGMQLAVRLPRDLGLAEELRAHASTTADQGPSCRALFAD